MELPRTIQVRYFERRQADLSHCDHFLKESNFLEITKVGHQLKGNGSMFGYDDLSDIGSRLEIAAKNNDESEVKKVLDEFKNWFNENHLLN